MAARAETIVHMSNLQKRIQDRKKVQQDLVHKKRDYEKQVSLEPGVDRSLFLLTHRNVIRRVCLRVVKSKPFEGLIIFAIVANSILLGLSDFSVVDKYLNPASDGVSFENGAIIKAFSMRNYILEVTETPFTILFTCEAIMKIIALGFVGSRGSYLRDSWNQLDFFVVLSSLVSVLPSVPNVSVIRTIRVLRPLRSLSMIPGLRRLISALLKALPALANVLALQFFVFLIFGILGIQLFGGNLNRRCRLTNFPVKLPMNSSVPQWPVPDDYLSQVLANPQAYRCLDAPMLDDGDLANGNFTKETSPWKRPQDCFWPFDADDSQVCVVPGVSGQHPCGTGRTCGSDFDTFGNPRFTLTKVTNSALYDVNFNWGYTSFDNIGRAFFTIFQSITQQGWTLLMYMTMDSGPPLAGAIFFVTLIVFASFFVMNLTLAVITDEFNIEDDTVPDKTEVEVRVDKIRAMAKAKLHIQRDKPRYPRLFSIVSHPTFSAFIMVVILANTTVLALDHYPMPSRLDSNLEIANFVLSCVFLLEMILKLLGLGFRLYTKDTFNLFDAFVVTMSVVETIVTPPSFFGTQEAVRKGAVSTLRSFRLFRIFKLARDWQSLRELLAMIVRAFASIGNFGVLLFLFIYIYALVGMQFFANTMRFDSDGYLIIGNGVDFWHGDLPRNNFDSMLWSVVTVFQIISGDNWNNVMYDTMRGNGWGASLYFITLIVLGNFILMNLFLALLLDNFDTSGNNSTAAETRTDRIKNLAIRMSTIKVLPIQQSARVLGVQEQLPSTTPAMRTKSSAEKGVMDKTSLNAAGLDNFSREEQHELAHRQCGSPSIRDLSLKKESITAQTQLQPQSRQDETLDPFKILPPKGKLFFFISESNPLRQFAYRLIIHTWFDSLILVLIVASSISLALDNPLTRPDSPLKNVLAKMDIAFTCVFMIEMAAKILALGLVAHKGSYLRNGWNILDGMIVIFSMITLIANASPRINAGKFKSLRSLRALRTFRPLRVISRRPGLRLVVNALIEAIPEVLNVMLLSMLLYLIFSIIAVNYLKGLLYACQGDVFSALSNDQQDFLTNPIGNWTQLDDVQRGWFVNTTCDRFSTLSGKITSRYICECWGAEWSDVIYDNFNNVGNAMLTFFEISTTEGWSTVMIAAIDTTDIDMQPIRDNTEAWAWFFVLFIMVGSFFVVNLFVGVIIDNFDKMKAVLGDDFLRSPEQKRWIEAISKVSRVVPVRPTKRPKHKLRACLFDLVKTRRFEWFIIVCILINTVLMGAQYFGQPTKMTEIIDMINQAFAVVFTLEAVLKLMAFGRAYFNDVWNQFDWLVVLGTLLSIVIEAMTGMSVRSLAMLVRVLRVTRVVRLVKASKSVRQILLTLYIALPGLSNISSLLFLILFIYATMGIQFFAKAKHFDNIDSHANFQNFWNAFLFLLRAATGEAWHDCMHDLANTSDCVDDPPYNESMCGFNDFEGCIPINGCGSPIAFLYFCSFTLLVTYVMLNLTIAVILEGFSLSQSQDDEPDEPLIEPEILDDFQLKWAEIDVNATGYIHIGKLRMLITLLEEPLGRKDVLTEKSAFIVYMRNLGLQMYDGNTIHFRDTLVAMARELVKETVSSDTDALDDLPISEQAHPSRLSMSYYAHEYCAVRVIEKCVRQWLRLKREFEQKSMEEYRSKIKKPAKRVRKMSNARVYTIM